MASPCRFDYQILVDLRFFSLISAILFHIVNLTSIHVSGDVVFEEGYTVTTVIDGNKKGINPYSVLPKSLSSSDLIILDSAGSAFYTLSFSDSQGVVIKNLSGNGVAGFLDGELDSAKFNKPKSFAVDLKENMYVADKNNHAIRKISKSGVTTIAGGYSRKPGHADGPGQNASFSNDFELAFIPERCALMISDHGNMLVRQINLKVEDCAKASKSVLGMTSAWALGLGFACLFGLIVGFVIRPYVAPCEGFSPLHYIETWKHCLISLGRRVPVHCFDWKHCLISLGRRVPMHCFDIRSAIVSSTFYALLRRLIMLSLSHLSLMFRLNIVEPRKSPPRSVSLLDYDDLGCGEITKSQMFAEQLKDLVSLDGGLESSRTTNEVLEQTDESEETFDYLPNNLGMIERMIQANIIGFAEQTKKTSLADPLPLESSSSLVKRKCK